MELGPLLTLGVLWVVVSLIGKIAGPQGKPGAKSRPQRPTTPPSGGGEPRKQPESFADLLEMMREQAEAAQREAEAPIAVEDAEEETEEVQEEPLTWDQPEEHEEVIHQPPVVVSMEEEPEFVERVFHDHRKESEDAISRRLDAAALRNRGRLPGDHARFDARIRRVPKPKHVRARVAARDLRKAVIWREILGPAVGLSPDNRER